ncbi:hypothetical protein DRP04_00680 [Archaeoglobales archaeon]|nr:MAG: hypothetical protein DRP04_00680 [Archaeoglobales archaeon]
MQEEDEELFEEVEEVDVGELMEEEEEEEEVKVPGIPPGYKLIREKRDVYSLRDPQGNVKFMCKYCGAILDRPFDIPRHKRVCPKIPREVARAEEMERVKEKLGIPESLEVEHKPEKPIPDKPLTPEEEVTYERKVRLYQLLMNAPGVKDEKRVRWVCDVFENTEALKTSPENLYFYLKSQFPKLGDKDAEYIVRSVFESDSSSKITVPFFGGERRESMYVPRFEDIHKPHGGPSVGIRPPSQGEDLTRWALEQLFNFITSQGKFIGAGQTITEEDLKKARELGRKEAELEFYKQRLQDVEKKLSDILTGKIKLTQTGRSEWDVAGDFIDRAFNLGDKAVAEFTKLTRLITAIILGKRSGMTSDEIYSLVKAETPEFVEEE